MNKISVSPLDMFQLYLGDAKQTFQICIAAKLAEEIDAERLRNAADCFASELPILCSRFCGEK